MSEAILTFQSQLSDIMDTVLKAAVFEITYLVEGSFHGEVVRSRQEVESLKQRLQLSERRWRERDEGVRFKCVECGRARVSNTEVVHRISENQSGVDEGCDIKEEKVLVEDQSSCLWKELEAASPSVLAITAAPSSTRTPEAGCATAKDFEGNRFDSMQIEEDFQEASSSSGQQGGLRVGLEKPEDRKCTGAETVVATQAEATVKLSEWHVTRHNVVELGGMDPVFREGPKHHTGNLNCLGSKNIVYEKVTVLADGDRDFSCTSREPRPELLHTQLRQQHSFKERGRTLKKNATGLPRPCDVVTLMRGSVMREDVTPEPKHQQYSSTGKHSQMARNESVAPASLDSLFDRGFAASENNETFQVVDTGDNQNICTYCGKSFSYVSRLKIHLQKHTGEKPFSCTQCGKRFTVARNLERHQQIHWGDAAFCCAQCGKSFRRADHLKVHQRVHTGERPYCCTQCNKCFRFSGDLNTHKRVHTGEKPYCCTICGNRFSQLRQLKSHQRIHKGLGRLTQLIP